MLNSCNIVESVKRDECKNMMENMKDKLNFLLYINVAIIGLLAVVICK